MSPSADLYEPLRNWDELLDDVVARGSRMRRRRLAARGVAVVAAVGLAFSASSALDHRGGPSSMQVLTTDPSPTAVPQPAGTVAPRLENAGTATPTQASRPSASAAPRHAPGVHFSVRKTQALAAPTTWPALSYSDPSGDVTGAGVDTTSQSGDITGMSFRSTAAGLVVHMLLLGYQDANHHYLAVLHSAGSSCDLRIQLDSGAPDATAVCGGATVWEHRLASYTDASQLQITLPWDAFPHQVSPHDALTTSGEVLVASTDLVVDSASSSRAIRFR